ncbi:hypothetical protein C5167_033767, partial [Papaver somniferum]
ELKRSLSRRNPCSRIFWRNNSFTGTIPEEIEELKELEVLDLGYNNFAGPVPSDLGSNLSLATLAAYLTTTDS